MSQDHQEITFLIPRPVKTEFRFLGMTRRHLVLVAPWAAAGLAMYYWGPRWLPDGSVHLAFAAGLGLTGWVVWGWQVGEDDRTLWDTALRWWRHASRQSLYLYRRERRAPCGNGTPPPTR